VTAILALPWALNIISDILIGDLAEYINKQRLIIFGLMLLAIIGIIYYLAESVWVIIFGLVLYGFAVDLYWIPTNSYLMGISPKKQDSEYYAIFDSL
jgi:MFS family permease